MASLTQAPLAAPQYTPATTEPPGRYLSARLHRQLIGVLGLTLPIMVYAIAWIWPNDEATRRPIRDSISAYYYTSAVAVFVGVLVALAVFLLVYQGYPGRRFHWADRAAAVIAGIAALGVAVCPMESHLPVTPLLWWKPISGTLHYVFATILFTMFAVFSLWLFRLTTPGSQKSRDKEWRNRFYTLCGIVIVASMVWARIAHVEGRPIFWPESIALVFFAFSWLVKGRAIAMIREKINRQATAHMKKVIPMLFIAASLNAQAVTRPDTTDLYRWLEEVNGGRAMSWVKAENAKTTAVLEADPRYADIYREAFRMASAKDRVPYPTFIDGELYNFWQDSAHKRGIWRKTSLESYRSKEPAWVTVLDLDTLAAHERANWVWHGASCALPAERRCLLELSDGGEDAVTVREFDLPSRAFVANGFSLPKGKQRVSWAGEDTLLVAREWKTGELTASGYPYITKRLARGQPLDAAVEIYRGDPKDVSVSASTLTDGKGHRISMIGRNISFFESESFIVRPNDVVRLNVPKKFEIQDLFDGQIIARLTQDWTVAGRTYKSGSVVSFDAAAATKDPQNLAPTLIIEPGPRESVSGVSSTKNQLLVGLDQNVKGRVLIFSRSPSGAWSRRSIALPDNVSTGVTSTDSRSDRAFINVTGFLTPSSVWLADAANGSATTLKSLPPRFDASSQVVEQLEATSKDGTKIPYFLVHPRNMKRDGSNPTLLYSYGGFEVSLTPFYSGSIGKLWLERGGVYVLANIRGGGEFGPAWHDAGLKTHRQVIYDDFSAVAQDLIAQKITTPRRLGIQGGSNGGLLMGVELTQHPELWNAVDIQVPLLDMMRFEQIAAGASWVGEYGSVSNPDERAFLESISPLHNLRAGVTYPMPLVWTTTKDDRVGPQHARKFAAKMADMKIPYLFYEVIEGGHGSGANIEQRAHTDALEFTYLARQLMDPLKATP